MIITEVLLSPYFLIVLFFALLSGFFAGLIFFHIFDSRVFDEKGQLIPGPKHHLWGKNNYFSIARLAHYSHQYSKVIYEKFLKEVGNGDIVAYNWINGKATIIVAHPDMAKSVLSGHHLKYLKDESWDNVKDLLGNGLGTCHVKIWQRYRNILSPLFRSSNLRDMVTTFNIHSRRLLRHWHFRLQQAIQDSPNLATTTHSTNTAASITSTSTSSTSHHHPFHFESSNIDKIYIKSLIDKELRHLVLGIICEAGFGYDFFTKKNSELFAQDFEILFNEFSLRMTSGGNGNGSNGMLGEEDTLFRIFGKSKFFPKSLLFSVMPKDMKQDQQVVQKALTHIQQLIEKTIHARLNGTLLDDDIITASSSPKSTPAPSPPPSDDGIFNELSSNFHTSQLPPAPPIPLPHPSLGKLSPQISVESEQTNDLLQLLLYANEDTIDYQKLSIEEIRDHILSFMILGFENTAMTLIWMIYELCLHQDIQKQCQKEIDSILIIKSGIKTSAVTYEDISKFHKLIQVLKETLRLHPPMSTITRKCTTSCNIGDYTIKSGSRISISLLALHQHPDYWYLPNDFFPDRFSTENINETIKHPFQYIPFGAGGRNCIGQRFSQMSIIVIMAILLSKYHFTLDEDDKLLIKFEEKASNGLENLRVVIQDRERSSSTTTSTSTSPSNASSTSPPMSTVGVNIPLNGGVLHTAGFGTVSGANSRSSSISSNPGSVGSGYTSGNQSYNHNNSNSNNNSNNSNAAKMSKVNFKQ